MDLEKLANNAADFALYSAMRNYIVTRIEYFMELVLSRNLSLALTITIALLTLWIMVQGFMIATGRSQEGLKGFLFNLGKSYFIVLMALGVSSNSSFAVRSLTEQLTNGISSIMTESNQNISKCIISTSSDMLGCKIDKNLATTQAVMGFINQVDTVDDPILEGKVEKAKLFAGIGTAGPAVVAGVMLILYRIAMALFIGFAPIFILCLLFKKTTPLFSKWLHYGLATIFSSVLLAVMADISSDLVEIVAKSLFVSKGLLEFVTGQGVGGISQTATQQLGLGMILSTLLITVPPMAGMWFNGVMSFASGFSPIQNWNNNPLQPTGNSAHDRTTGINEKDSQTDSRGKHNENNYPNIYFNSNNKNYENQTSSDVLKNGTTFPSHPTQPSSSTATIVGAARESSHTNQVEKAKSLPTETVKTDQSKSQGELS